MSHGAVQMRSSARAAVAGWQKVIYYLLLEMAFRLTHLRVSVPLEELWCCPGLTMASSSERGVAPGAPPPPPPPGEVAAFYALLEKQTTACVLWRHTRAAELSDRAATQDVG